MRSAHLAIRGLCLLTVALAGSAARAEWKAGLAQAVITPEQPTVMSGYAGRDQPATEKLTDLKAKVLVLEGDGGQRVALITLDLIGLDRGVCMRLARELEAKHKLPRANFALCSSHTHSGPVVGENLNAMFLLDELNARRVVDYTAKLEAAIVDAVGRAIADLAPAEVLWGTSQASFAVNRRNNKEPDVPQLRADGQLKGPVDHDFPVLAVKKPDGELRALVFGYACHATVLNGLQWCADWPGYAQLEVERRHPGVQAMFWAGCGADQNPLPRRKVELAQEYGRQSADAVDAALKSPLQKAVGPITAEYAEIAAPYAALPTKEEMEKTAQTGNKYEALRAKRLLAALARDGSLADSYPYPVQSWQLGDGPSWIFLGGEVVVDYALRIKGELNAARTWVAGYSNDVMAYIASKRVLAEGGYEGGGAMVFYGLPSPWAPAIEDRIDAEVRRQVQAAKAARDKILDAAAGPARYGDRAQLLVYQDAEGREQPVKTAADWAQRRKDILRGMEQAMGPLPDRTRLVPLVVHQETPEDGDGFTRVKLTYDVEPGDRVPAHLYLPKAPAAGKRSAMLALHQTAASGKLNVSGEKSHPNLAYGVELARRGYVVLAPDYPSFGDYQPYDFAADRYASGTMKGIFNHMRGVDLLAAMPEVDPERIGVIGHSLGGHNSIFVAAFDPRIKVCVTSCGWDPYRYYYQGNIKGWTSDRYMPRLLTVYELDLTKIPFDFYEVVASIAPRAFFSCSPLGDDNFQAAGVQDAEKKCREIYQLLGADQDFVIRYPDAKHDFPTPTRQEAYEFVDRVLQHTPAK